MIFLWTLTILLSFLALLWNKNPLKVRISLIAISLGFFFILHYKDGLIFYPVLMAILFIGGIIMVFIVLRSVSPNEKFSFSGKFFLPISLGAGISFFPLPCHLRGLSTLYASAVQGASIIVSFAIIFFYFYSFIQVITWEKVRLRSF